MMKASVMRRQSAIFQVGHRLLSFSCRFNLATVFGFGVRRARSAFGFSDEAIAGKTDAAAALISLGSTWARISTLRRHVRVALDGEVVRLVSPLVYSIRPAALKVLVPREPVETAEDR